MFYFNTNLNLLNMNDFRNLNVTVDDISFMRRYAFNLTFIFHRKSLLSLVIPEHDETKY